MCLPVGHGEDPAVFSPDSVPVQLSPIWGWGVLTAFCVVGAGVAVGIQPSWWSETAGTATAWQVSLFLCLYLGVVAEFLMRLPFVQALLPGLAIPCGCSDCPDLSCLTLRRIDPSPRSNQARRQAWCSIRCVCSFSLRFHCLYGVRNH